jgi:hypothetical protein
VGRLASISRGSLVPLAAATDAPRRHDRIREGPVPFLPETVRTSFRTRPGPAVPPACDEAGTHGELRRMGNGSGGDAGRRGEIRRRPEPHRDPVPGSLHRIRNVGDHRPARRLRTRPGGRVRLFGLGRSAPISSAFVLPHAAGIPSRGMAYSGDRRHGRAFHEQRDRRPRPPAVPSPVEEEPDPLPAHSSSRPGAGTERIPAGDSGKLPHGDVRPGERTGGRNACDRSGACLDRRGVALPNSWESRSTATAGAFT